MNTVTMLRKIAVAGLMTCVFSQVKGAETDATPESVKPLDKTEVAKQAFELLRTRCYQCHGEQFQYKSLDVLDRETLIGEFVSPGEPDKSAIWDAISDNRMPKGASSEPESRIRPLSLEDKAVIKQWIEQGAEFPSRARFNRTKFVTQEMVLKGVLDFLQSKDRDSRQFYKFFSLSTVYNNTAFSDDDLKMRKAALSKLLNSVSRSNQIIIPEAVKGTEETVFAVDWKRGLRLDLNDWRSVLQEYPYGLKYVSSSSDELKHLYENLEELIQPLTERDGIYVIRGDWFIATASRPPLYHTLAGIPTEFSELEKELGIKIADNFKSDVSKRIAIQRSGVSKQNRVLEWHDAQTRKGTLWVSYDFGKNVGKATIEIKPLGPRNFVQGGPLQGFAFEHDGGEMIYPRANGLHGYMLSKSNGERIDKGPIDIVSDPSEASGTPQIVNGISCMHCHRHGMLIKYEASPNTAVIGNAAAMKKVGQIYATEKEALFRFEEDKRNFMDALTQAIGPFLVEGYDTMSQPQRVKAVERFDDPVSVSARHYRGDVGIRQVALELDWPFGHDSLANKLDTPELKRFGIGPLVRRDKQQKLKSGAIKRELWDDRDEGGESLYQFAARQMGIGTGVNHAKPGK